MLVVVLLCLFLLFIDASRFTEILYEILWRYLDNTISIDSLIFILSKAKTV